MSKKKILKQLRQISKIMEVKGTHTTTLKTISGEDLILAGHKKVEGNEIVKDKEYTLNVPTFIAFNNYRELKKAAKRGPENLVNFYKQWQKQ